MLQKKCSSEEYIPKTRLVWLVNMMDHINMLWLKKYSVAVLVKEQLPEDG
jgi:hypothetical protein